MSLIQTMELYEDNQNDRCGKLDAPDQEVEAAAKLANADTFIQLLPEGYDMVITGDGLSQGQRQLYFITRATVADLPVLIL